MDLSKIRVLFIFSDEIKSDDILWGLIGLGINVSGSNVVVSINDICEEQVIKLSNELKEFDYAFTQDFSVNVAVACNIAQVKYISWIYDSPQIALYTPYALLPTNYIFCFDKVQVERLKATGIQHVFHQPLAGNTAYVSTIDFNSSAIKIPNADVSFIGQMYNSTLTSSLFNKMSCSEANNFIAENAQYICNWAQNSNIFNRRILQNEPLKKYIKASDLEYFHIDIDYVAKVMFNTPYLANCDRTKLLETASKNFNTILHTKESDITVARKIKNLTVYGPVKNDIPYRIYKSSKLNLNITLRSIESGIPQRVFDIMVAGGAVISNFQAEINELFIPGKDIVTYENVEEFIEKIDFFSKHPNELKNIASSGQAKIFNEYNYQIILPKIFVRTI